MALALESDLRSVIGKEEQLSAIEKFVSGQDVVYIPAKRV